MRRSALPAAFAAAVLLAVPAVAEPAPATTVSEQVYFHCGDTKLANADYQASGSLPTWDTTAPTASVQQGAGCGWADSFSHRSTAAGNSAHDGAWKGTFTGNLGSLTAQLHSISAGPGRAGLPQSFNVTLYVDGVSVFGLDADGRATRARVTLTPVVSSTQVSSLYEFTVTGLPFVTEEGDGTREREVILNVAASSEPLMGWVYDTTEVPSGIEFNPAEPAPVSVVVGG